MGGVCSNNCRKFDRLLNYCSDDCDFNDEDSEMLQKGQRVNILSNKVRMIIEVESEAKCKMDVVLYNRSDQICGEMSRENLASFHRSEIECFEDEAAHVLQVDMTKIHDEIQSIEFLLSFAEAQKKITASVGVLEDSLTRETICEFDLTKLALSGDQNYSVARIKRSNSVLDAWVAEATLSFHTAEGARGLGMAGHKPLHEDAYLARLLSDSYLGGQGPESPYGKSAENATRDTSDTYSAQPQQQQQQQGANTSSAINAFPRSSVQSSLSGAAYLSPVSRGQGNMLTPMSRQQNSQTPSLQRPSGLTPTREESVLSSTPRKFTPTIPQIVPQSVLESATHAAFRNVEETSPVRAGAEPRKVVNQEPASGLVFGSQLSDADDIIEHAKFFPRTSRDAPSPASKQEEASITMKGASPTMRAIAGYRAQQSSGSDDHMYKPANVDKPKEEGIEAPETTNLSHQISGILANLDQSPSKLQGVSARSSNVTLDFN
eukprot:GEMP01012437.1.p1 GENE.GEMP01012437.1~~GEMP01012437.1.p1  ORF type:complete len:490 (+),score=88.61 GEMP01012437.1:173-1642(+)